MTDGTTTWNYIYDANGMRTSRTNGTTAYNYVYNGGSLSQMTVGNNTLNFAYDASGVPMMVTYNGTNYYYIVNLQGDVMGIVNANGTLVVSYTYDAWGKPLSITGSMANTLGALNPLRYRSYVYDSETGYYYLQSRYYDPKISRFLNADSSVSTGQGFVGNNMFAYCLNNPVNGCDPCGTCFHRLDFWNDCEKCGGKTIGDKWDELTTWCKDTYTAIKNYVTNDDASVAETNLKNDGFTFYKGVPVIRVDSMGYGGLSFGIILMGGSNVGDPKFSNTLKHEYGHAVHLSQIGPIDYFFSTAIPSLILAEATNRGVFPNQYYYDLPWERTADQLGGVQRNYLPTSNFLGSVFWIWTKLYSLGTLG